MRTVCGFLGDGCLLGQVAQQSRFANHVAEISTLSKTPGVPFGISGRDGLLAEIHRHVRASKSDTSPWQKVSDISPRPRSSGHTLLLLLDQQRVP